jgi:hypothetical protein
MIPISLPEISEHQFGFGAKILHQKFRNPNLVLVPSFFARNLRTSIWFWCPISLLEISQHQFGFTAK